MLIILLFIYLQCKTNENNNLTLTTMANKTMKKQVKEWYISGGVLDWYEPFIGSKKEAIAMAHAKARNEAVLYGSPLKALVWEIVDRESITVHSARYNGKQWVRGSRK